MQKDQPAIASPWCLNAPLVCEILPGYPLFFYFVPISEKKYKAIFS